MNKEQDIVTGNKLIAEFMGIEFGKAKYSYRPGVEEPLTEDHLNYHGSWGWLMDVVEKIESLDIGATTSILLHITTITVEGEGMIARQVEDKSKIENCWQAVIQFIQWYQQNQKPQ